MALQKSYDSRYGITIPNAYHQVIGIGYDTANNSMSINVGVFVSQAAKNSGCPAIDTMSFNVSTFDKTLPVAAFTLIYAYLKGLPEYAGAVDV